MRSRSRRISKSGSNSSFNRLSQCGSVLVETITIAIVLVPIALCLLDLLFIVLANSMNDTAAKNAARAAANQEDPGQAFSAAQDALSTFKASALIKSIDLDLSLFNYPKGGDTVTVGTRMKLHLPVPFPGLSDLQFDAKDVEPIVATSPPSN